MFDRTRHEANEAFKALTTYRQSAVSGKKYSFTDGTDIDITRCLNGLPYWEAGSVTEHVALKHLVMTDWSLKLHVPGQEGFWRYLINHHPQVYVFNSKTLGFNQVRDFPELEDAAEETGFVKTEGVRAILADAGHAKDSIEVLDYNRVRELQVSLAPLLPPSSTDVTLFPPAQTGGFRPDLRVLLILACPDNNVLTYNSAGLLKPKTLELCKFAALALDESIFQLRDVANRMRGLKESLKHITHLKLSVKDASLVTLIVNLFPNIKDLTIDGVQDTGLTKGILGPVLKSLTIESLTINNCQHFDWEGIPKNYPYLKKLSVTAKSASGEPFALPSLTHLCLKAPATEAEIGTIINAHPQLEYLDVESATLPLSRLSRIQTLKLTSCKLEQNDFQQFLTNCSSTLATLELNGMHMEKVNIEDFNPPSLTKLTSLETVEAYDDEPMLLAKVLRNSPNLSKFLLSSTSNEACDIFLDALASPDTKLDELTSLTLYIDDISVDTLSSILNKCRRLDTLDCPEILPANIPATGSPLPMLTELNYESALDSDAIRLCQLAPNVKRVTVRTGDIDPEIKNARLPSVRELNILADISAEQLTELLEIFPNADRVTARLPLNLATCEALEVPGNILLSRKILPSTSVRQKISDLSWEQINLLSQLNIDRLHVEQASGEFASLVNGNPYLADLTIKQTVNLPFIDGMTNLLVFVYPGLKQLSASFNFNSQDLEAARGQLKNRYLMLESIDLTNSNINAPALSLLLDHCNDLKKLSLQNCPDIDGSINLPATLHELNISNAPLFNDDTLSRALCKHSFYFLRSLTLDQCPNIKGTFTNVPPYLEELRIQRIDFSLLLSILGSAKNLKNLLTPLTPGEKAYLTQHFPNLKLPDPLLPEPLPANQAPYNAPVSFNTDTRDTNRAFTVRSFYELKPNEEHNPELAYSRLQVRDRVILRPDAVGYASASLNIEPIHFEKMDPVLLYKNYRTQHRDKADYFYGQITIPAQAGANDWFPVPALTSADEISQIAATPDVPIELGYDKQKRLYFIRAKSPLAAPLSVSFLNRADLQGYKFQMNPSITGYPELFTQLKFGMDGKLIQNEAYLKIKKMFDELRPRDSITYLALFCRAFEPKELKNPHHETRIHALNASLHEKAGVCHHRSIVFEALAQELGVTASVIRSDCHEFVEVLVDGKLQMIDLGGGTGRLIKQDLLRPPLLEPEITLRAPAASTAASELSRDNPFICWDTIKSSAASYPEYCRNLRDATFRQKPGTRNTLVIVDNSQIEPLQAELTRSLQATGGSSMYLHSLDEVCEREVTVLPDGKLQTSASELMRLATQGKGESALISNWSDYKPALVGYNCMMDETRSLRNQPVAENLGVIVFMSKDQAKAMGEDFYSRFPVISECPQLPRPPSVVEKIPVVSASPVPDGCPPAEFFSDDWQGMLIGRITINGKSFTQQAGLLVNAIREKAREINLINAPWEDVSFRLFISDLLEKKTIRFNGETLHLPEGFQIYRQSKPLKLNSERLSFPPLQSWASGPQPCILNAMTFPSFLHTMRCTDAGLTTPDGWIKQHAGNTLRVLVTDTLPANRWAQLISVAEEHGTRLELVLAPGAGLPQGMGGSQETTDWVPLESENIRFVTSNDIDLAEEHLFEQEKPLMVISINAETRLSDLTGRPVMMGDPKKDPATVSFSFRECVVWQRLMEGKTIILKGPVSAGLASELASLFQNPPYLWVNGKKQCPSGKLILLGDQNPAPWLRSHEMKFKAGEAIERLRGKPHFEKLMAAYKVLKERHPNLDFNYGQLRAMLKKLANGSTANPFKPYLRLSPQDPALASAKELWSKPGKTSNPDVITKRRDKLMRELERSPYLFIAGESGVGKSTFVQDKLEENECTVLAGIDKLKEWLNTKSDKPVILFIDEANLEREGAWDLFEGIFNQTPGILMDGVFHPLLANHKIVFAGNYNHFAGRHRHRFIEKHGQIINFKAFPDDVLISEIIKPAMSQAVPALADNRQIQEMLIKQYHAFTEHPLTPRNIKMIILRLAYYLGRAEIQNNTNLALYLAIRDELGGRLNVAKIQELRTNLGITEPDEKIRALLYQPISQMKLKDFIITPSRHEPLHILSSQLDMREMLIRNPQMHFNLSGVLIEGPAGIGKSKMVIRLLEAAGFSADAVDTTRKYYHIEPTDPAEMRKILIQAYQEGAVVVIDEINSLPLESLLNQLMSGQYKSDIPVKPGFWVIGTQNPITFTGRQALSPALENRFTKIYPPDYPEPELRTMANQICAEKGTARNTVDQYLQAKAYAQSHNKTPAPTPRNLFRHFGELKKRMELNAAASSVSSNPAAAFAHSGGSPEKRAHGEPSAKGQKRPQQQPPETIALSSRRRK